MTTQWSIAIDWDRNGSFNDANDDVTSRVISAIWFLGSRQIYQDCADNSRLELTLNNEDRLFSPDYITGILHGKLLPQRPVKISSVTRITDTNGNQVVDQHGDPVIISHTHWLGWTESIEATSGQYSKRTV